MADEEEKYIDPDFGFLGQLFGPKGENEDLVVKLVTTVLLDYSYWRKNYFPDDPLVLTSEMKRKTETHQDRLFEMTASLVAKLRRSFPIYSPRYIGHQLSETTIASVVGAFAGTLYNSNNVTPEAGIETVDMEIDACNELLKLLGFRTPPPLEEAYKDYKQYTGDLEKDFGWCHLTSGGTVANLEALWVARAVKFFPLALRDACDDAGIDLQVAPAGSPSRLVYGPTGVERDHDRVSLGSLVDDRSLIEFRPMEVLRMLGKATRLMETETTPEQRGHRSAEAYLWHLLNKSERGPGRGVFQTPFKPKIFTTGAAHYSVLKAADILGIGREAVVDVPMDRGFRMDIDALWDTMEKVRNEEPDSCVLAVIGAVGTTEEGAVDYIDQIVQLRREWEAKRRESFWIHVDAAWGGFIRSLFVDPKATPGLTREQFQKTLAEIQKDVLAKEPFSIPRVGRVSTQPQEWLYDVIAELNAKMAVRTVEPILPLPTPEKLAPYFVLAAAKNDYSDILVIFDDVLRRAAIGLGEHSWRGLKAYIDSHRRNLIIQSVQGATKYALSSKRLDAPHRPEWPDRVVVGQAFLAIEDADSVTIDPHKMGYCVYPNGAVAYRSDLVRHFIKHEAPYITTGGSSTGGADADSAERQRAAGHFPIRHVKETDGRKAPATEAFARYILEGSRPGAAACSLWLASKTLPFDKEGIGTLISSSLWAARTLYHYLDRWDLWRDDSIPCGPFTFALYSSDPPDTNIVIFALVPGLPDLTLEQFNRINNKIYRKFSILAEDGNRSFSYSQPFFLSKTDFKYENYPYAAIHPFLEANGIVATAEEYDRTGIVVLRATVMNPYLRAMKERSMKDLLFDFVTELEQEATRVIELEKSRAKANAAAAPCGEPDEAGPGEAEGQTPSAPGAGQLL